MHAKARVCCRLRADPPLTPSSLASKKLEGSVAPVKPRQALHARVSFDSLRTQLLIAWMVVVYLLRQDHCTAVLSLTGCHVPK